MYWLCCQGSSILKAPLPIGCSRKDAGSSRAACGTGTRLGWQTTAGKSAMGAERVT